MRPFTGKGDSGHSSTSTSTSLPKYHDIFHLLGQFDSLNAQIGFARTHISEQTASLDPILYKLQNELFEIGAALNLSTTHFNIQQALTEMEIVLQNTHDPLPALTNFILPGGSPLAACLHLCRTQSRELERIYSAYFLGENKADFPYLATIMKYLNRLSSLFFTLARSANSQQNIADVIWQQITGN